MFQLSRQNDKQTIEIGKQSKRQKAWIKRSEGHYEHYSYISNAAQRLWSDDIIRLPNCHSLQHLSTSRQK